MTIVAKPTITNTTMTDADTEYSYALPDGTRRFSIKLNWRSLRGLQEQLT